MLFADKRLSSPYDFDRELPDEQKSIYALAKHIVGQIDRLFQYTENEKNHVELYYHDNHDEKIYVEKIDVGVFDRNIPDIQQLLYRDANEKISIAGYLAVWGIERINEKDADFGNYLKLLYFFYMVRYVIFSDVNIFILLDVKHMSTDMSPVDNASNGKYFSFIMNNLLDSDGYYKRFMEQDQKITRNINEITYLLDNLITVDDMDSVEYYPVLDYYVSSVKMQLGDDLPEGNVVERAADYVYRYQNLAFADEIIQNLQNNVFCFGEMEIEADPVWKKEYINADVQSCMDFLNQDDVKNFYMQSHTHVPKYMENFVENIIQYDLHLYENEGYFLWIEEKNGKKIMAYKLAIIVKAFLDLGTEKFKMKAKITSHKWKKEHSYRQALTGFVPDISMRYFFIAFVSELMNSVKGYGYYPVFFQPIYIRKYMLIQNIMKTAFSIRNQRSRIKYLSQVREKIEKLSQ